MPPDASADLEQARAAFARRAWADAFELFRQCDAQAPLAPPDLECLLWCAGMLDRDADLFPACERLFESSVQAQRHDAAAHWAFFHGFRLFALREHGRASAWMQRASEHVDRFGRECAAAGYLLLPRIMKAFAASDFEAAAAEAEQAVAVAGRCGDADLLAMARGLLGRIRVRQGRTEEGIALLDAAMLAVVGDELRSPVMSGLVYCNLIACCRQVYALDRSREWTRALSRWCDSQPQLVQFGGVCRLHQAEILELDGAWEEAIAAARTAADRAASGVAAETRAGSAYQEAEIHRLRGEFDAAEAMYREASRLGLEPQPGLALLQLARGEGAQAAAMLRRLLAATPDTLARARLLPAFVEVLLHQGAVDEARQATVELEQIAARFATPILQAIAAEARGEIELRDGDPAGALARLQSALAAWQEAGAPYIVARLRVRIAAACDRLGDAAGACLHLDAARETFRALGATVDLARSEEGPGAAAPRPATLGLTEREIEVLRLVAAGKTNKGIARDLGLSEKTVDRHVSNIFDKLAVPSRAAATALAYQHRLL